MLAIGFISHWEPGKPHLLNQLLYFSLNHSNLVLGWYLGMIFRKILKSPLLIGAPDLTGGTCSSRNFQVISRPVAFHSFNHDVNSTRAPSSHHLLWTASWHCDGNLSKHIQHTGRGFHLRQHCQQLQRRVPGVRRQTSVGMNHNGKLGRPRGCQGGSRESCGQTRMSQIDIRGALPSALLSKSAEWMNHVVRLPRRGDPLTGANSGLHTWKCLFSDS